MPTQISEVVQHFCKAVLRHDEAGLTDGQLLGRFIEQRDEAAVAALVRRHGPMVWGVCLRILHTHHDAEDAFQATFLVLLRKAGSVRKREMVGNWLYGVAHQTALKARAMATKKFARERQVVDMPEPAMTEPDLSRELQAVLDQELSRLPDKYRVAIVLCDLEGIPRKAAAQQLGLPEGTVAGRLTRGRAMLAKRLARHGLAVTGGTLTAWLSQSAASACVPTSVLTSTTNIVTSVAAGKAVATGLVSAKVAALTEGVMKAMLISKLKTVVAIVLVLGFIVSGATVLSCRTSAAQGDKLAIDVEHVNAPQKQEPEKEGFTAWGKEAGGLQAGLSVRPGEKRVYRHGEVITLVVRVRNVGKETVKFEYVRQFLDENLPTVTTADGTTVEQRRLRMLGFHVPMEVSLEPGKEIELESRLPLRYEFRPGNDGEKATTKERPLFVGIGKVSIQYEQVLGSSSSGAIKIDPVLSKLATGKVEFEIKAAENDKKTPPKQEKQPDKKPAAGLTARIVAPAEVASTSFEFKGELVLTNEGDADVRICTLCSDGGLFDKVFCPHKWKSDSPSPDMSARSVVTLAPGESVALPFGIRSVHYKDLDKFTITASYVVDKNNNLCTKLNLWSGTAKAKPAVVRVVKTPAGEKEAKPAKEKEGFTAWGKEIGGLQAGLGYHPDQKRAYIHGETVKLVVRVRNVGKEEVNFQYLRHFFIENPPAVVDDNGKPVPLKDGSARGIYKPVDMSLAPGKDIELYELNLELSEKGNNQGVGVPKDSTLYGTGKFSVQYERILGNSSLTSVSIKFDPILSKLGTGKLELEIDPMGAPKGAGDTTTKKLWAGMTVNQPLFRAGQNTNLLQFNFALINESDKVLDPKLPGYPRLIVNDKELDLSSIPGVGPRDGRFKALPSGDNIQFGMGAGQFFDKPGVYRVYWQGAEFRSNEVVFRVVK